MRILSTLLTAALVVTALGMLSTPPSGAADAHSGAASLSAPADDMPGCPGKANGGACCASCQEHQAEAAAAPEQQAPKPCPCQERARRMREAQEAARAAQQQ